jgi:HEAT repeat protein
MRKSVILSGFARRRSERAGAKLLEIAQSSDNLELRKAAIRAIPQRSSEGAVDILLRLYDSERNEELRDHIINAIGNSNDQRVTLKLIEIAKNPQTPIERRKRAVGWLSRSKDPAVLKFLEDLLKQ